MEKFKRLLLLAILFVFSVCLSYTLQVSASELADSSESFIQATFTGNTITVSSSRDVYFVLVCEVSGNTTKSNWESNSLFINSSVTKTYNLKTLFPDFDSLDVTLTSVKIENINQPITPFGFLIFIILFFFLILIIVSVSTRPITIEEIMMSDY